MQRIVSLLIQWLCCKEEYNNRVGKVLHWDSTKGRYAVAVAMVDFTLMLRPANLMAVDSQSGVNATTLDQAIVTSSNLVKPAPGALVCVGHGESML